jgi:hypothetical protein
LDCGGVCDDDAACCDKCEPLRDQLRGKPRCGDDAAYVCVVFFGSAQNKRLLDFSGVCDEQNVVFVLPLFFYLLDSLSREFPEGRCGDGLACGSSLLASCVCVEGVRDLQTKLA